MLSQVIHKAGYSHFCCGSLPGRSAADAVQFVFSHPFVLPFWPELPSAAGFSDSIVGRSSSDSAGKWGGYTKDQIPGLTVLKARAEAEGAVFPVLKCQITGPLSIAQYSSRATSRSDAIKEATELCLRQMSWQKKYLEGIAKTLLFVVDDPALAKWDEIDEGGLALVLESYNDLYVGSTEQGCFLGLHSCAAFNRNLLSFPVEFYSFDAVVSESLLRSKSGDFAALQSALNRGLVIAPGVFPACVQRVNRDPIDAGLAIYEELQNNLTFPDSKGRTQMLLSANCGHGTASAEWVELLYGTTAPDKLMGYFPWYEQRQ